MQPEFVKGFNAEQGAAVSVDRDGNNHFRPAIPINGSLPVYTTLGAGTTPSEGFATLVPGARSPVRRRRRRFIRRRRRDLVYCPYIGISGSEVDLFRSESFNVLSGSTDHGVVAHGEFAGGATTWYSTTVNGALGEIYLNASGVPLANKTFTEPASYAGDVAVKSKFEWLDLTGSYDQTLFDTTDDEEVYKLPFGFGQSYKYAVPVPIKVDIYTQQDITVFRAIWLVIDQYKLTVQFNGASGGFTTTRSALERGIASSVAGQTRNLVYFERDFTTLTNGNVTATATRSNSLFRGSGGDFIDINPWAYLDETNNDTLSRTKDRSYNISYDPDPTSTVTDEGVRSVLQEQNFYGEGSVNLMTDVFTLDTSFTDPDGYILTTDQNRTGIITDFEFDSVAQPTGSTPLTVSQYVSLIESQIGYANTVYEKDTAGDGNFLPSTKTVFDTLGFTNTLMDDFQDGLGGFFTILGINTSFTGFVDQIEYSNTIEISNNGRPDVNCYLCVSIGGGLYDVYTCRAKSNPTFDPTRTALPTLIDFTTIDLSGVAQILSGVPWFPSAVEGKDTLASRNIDALKITPQNTVTYSDLQAANVLVEGDVN